MVSSGSSAVRVKKFILGFAVGLVAGFLFIKVPAWVSPPNASRTLSGDRHAEDAEVARSNTPRGRERRHQALQPVTASQLTQLGTGSAQAMTYSGWLQTFQTAAHESEDQQEQRLRSHLESTTRLLSLNEKEAALLGDTLISGVRQLVQLEQTSLSIRESKPGTLILDFDAQAEDRRKILDDMRANLRRDLGERMLQDLDVLQGFDSFTERPGASQNCEISISRRDGEWRTYAIEPDLADPSAGYMVTATFPGNLSEKEVYQAVIKAGADHRYGHISGRLPETFSPVP